eukprot:669995-Rhodomonas_salina.1
MVRAEFHTKGSGEELEEQGEITREREGWKGRRVKTGKKRAEDVARTRGGRKGGRKGGRGGERQADQGTAAERMERAGAGEEGESR